MSSASGTSRRAARVFGCAYSASLVDLVRRGVRRHTAVSDSEEGARRVSGSVSRHLRALARFVDDSTRAANEGERMRLVCEASVAVRCPVAYRRGSSMGEHRSECMIEGAARPEWGRLPVAAVVIVSFLLAAIVGMTSAATPWLPGDGSRSSPPRILGEVLAVALASGLCILLALIWIHTPRRGKSKRPGRPPIDTEALGSSLRASFFVLIGGILVVFALVIVFWFLLEQANLAKSPPPSATPIGAAAALPSSEAPPSVPPVFDWFLFGFAASIAVVLPLALLARRRSRVTDEPQLEDSEVPESVVRAVGESIDQIEGDPDARRAIIRAYAQMEHAFDDAGIPRRPHEAPFEYLGRALRGLRVSPPGRRASRSAVRAGALQPAHGRRWDEARGDPGAARGRTRDAGAVSVSRTAVHRMALGAVAAVGLGVAVLVSPGAPGLTVEIYLFVVAVLVLAAVVIGVAHALPLAEPVQVQRPPRSERVGQLESVARALKSGHAAPTVAQDAVNGLGFYRANLRHGIRARHSMRTDIPVQLVEPALERPVPDPGRV